MGKSEFKPAPRSDLKLVIQPEEYFYELVAEAMGRKKIATLPEIEVYLVHLLGQFMKTESLYPVDADGHIKEEPLVLLIKEALEAPQPETQRSMFRYVGDLSLYTAGYFQDSLNHKMVDLDYYIDLGGTAYRNVASRAEEAPAKELYGQLADHFGQFVDVLAEVSDHTTSKSEKDLVRLYEMYNRTGSERAAKALKEAGILLDQTNSGKKKLQ